MVFRNKTSASRADNNLTAAVSRSGPPAADSVPMTPAATSRGHVTNAAAPNLLCSSFQSLNRLH